MSKKKKGFTTLELNIEIISNGITLKSQLWDEEYHLCDAKLITYVENKQELAHFITQYLLDTL